jgi:hypothetical protein
MENEMADGKDVEKAYIGYTGDYGFITRSAHRKPAPPVKPPALTRHHAFGRFGDLKDDDWYKYIEKIVQMIVQSAVKESTNVKISNLHDDLIELNQGTNKVSLRLLRNSYFFYGEPQTKPKPKPKPEESSDTPTPAYRYETVQLTGKWFDREYWIRFEVFEEYFTISVCLGLDSFEDSSPSNAFFDGVKKIIVDLNDRHNIASPANPETKGNTLIGDDALRVFSEIWDKFQEQILSVLYGFEGTTESASAMESLGMAASVFADFRGVVLGLDCNSEIDTQSITSQSRKIQGPTLIKTRPQGFRERLRIGEAELEEYDERCNAWVDTLKRLLMSSDCVSDSFLDPVEYTFSTFGDGRYIYGSGFGPHKDLGPKSNKKISYVVLCTHDEWRQIGRLIGRLHTLGTLRLAALFELDKLMRRDTILLTLDKELDEFDHANRVDDSEKLNKANIEALIEFVHTLRDYFPGIGEQAFTNFESTLGTYFPDIDLSKCSKEEAKNDLSADERKAVEKVKNALGADERSAFDNILRLNVQPSSWKDKLKPKLPYSSLVLSKANQRDVELLHGKLLNIRKELTKERDKSAAKLTPKALMDVRKALRKSERFSADSIVIFEDTVLNHVRSALADMNESIRDGISYRAARSKYYRELFGTLSKAMRIRRIRGYQPYDVFVEHRLDRAYRHAQAIEARFRQISMHEARLRKQLNSERSEKHQRIIAKLQWEADIALRFVLAPYYLGSVIKLILTGLGVIGLGKLLVTDWEKIGTAVGAAIALLVVIFSAVIGFRKKSKKK